MAQGKKEYLVIEPRSPQQLQEELNKHSMQGHDVIAVLPYGTGFIVVFSKVWN
jgi:hypothetical protein